MADEIKIQLPDAIIHEHVKVAVAQALMGDDPEKLIQAVVNEALKETNRYDHRDSAWSQGVKAMIEEMAKGIMKEWVEENKEKIKIAITLELKRSNNKLIKALVGGVLDNFAAYNLEVNFNVNPPKARY